MMLDQVMTITTRQDLQSFINSELSNAMFYAQLAQIAPNEQYSNLLMGISKDKQELADIFRGLYRKIFRENYTPDIARLELRGTFEEILHNRVLSESENFRKYGIKLAGAGRNNELKTAYEKAKTDANVHALRLLYMLHISREE